MKTKDKTRFSNPPCRLVVVSAGAGILMEGATTALNWAEVDPDEDLLLACHPHGKAFIPCRPADDLSVMGWLLAPWHAEAPLTLPELAKWHGIDLPEHHAAPGDAITERVMHAITSAAKRIHATLEREIRATGLFDLYRDLERPVTHLLREMEATGVPVTRGEVDLSATAPETQRQWRGWPARWTGVDGRVHPAWFNTAAVTGRVSSRNPPIQALPKVLRHSIAVPNGRFLVVADYSTADFRAAAALASDRTLIKHFASGVDAYESVGAGAGRAAQGRHREVGKALALAALYGARVATLADNLKLPISIVEQAIEHYRRVYPRLWKWREEVIAEWRTNGGLRNPWGRLLGPETEQQAINYMCQSATADLMKTAMLRIRATLGSTAKIIGQVHDELLVECAGADVATVAEIVETEMTRPVAQLPVELAVKVGVGRSWAEAAGGG